jgi:hypothetical protein
MIPDDRELPADLTGGRVRHGHVLRDGRDVIILENKEDMKRRDLASPDLTEAVALTFAYNPSARLVRTTVTSRKLGCVKIHRATSRTISVTATPDQPPAWRLFMIGRPENRLQAVNDWMKTL